MSGRRFALIAALAFLVMFIAANVIAGVWFRGWRLDLPDLEELRLALDFFYPAAIGMAMPRANLSISLTASLGITFPFNLILGLPLYLELATFLESVRPCKFDAHKAGRERLHAHVSNHH